MSFSVLIVRLSSFGDVVKSTPHQFLYGECVRVLPDEAIDFAFLPPPSQRKEGAGLRGMRTGRDAKDFDLWLVSNSYAVELINLPYLLHLAGIPMRGGQRDASAPLVVMGGSNAMASQAILYGPDEAMVDALYFGEGEYNVTSLVKALSEVPRPQRRETLSALQRSMVGLKVFGTGEAPVRKAIFADTSHEVLANAKQYLFDSDQATTARLQITYGCPFFCTFCFEGWERKPYREVPVDQIIGAAKKLKRETGADTLEITAFNFNTHSEVVRIFTELDKLFFRVNFMSQRADILAANPSLLDFEIAADKRQYTIGVEGISERMRRYYHKNLSREVLLSALTLLLSRQIREVKLFFILSGLETEDDFRDFRGLLKSIETIKAKGNRGIRVLFSFGLLVRMPFTPLMFERLLLTPAQWDPVVASAREAVQSAGYEFRLTYPYEEYFLSQSLVMTSQYLAPVLEEMGRRAMVYDGSLPSGVWEFFSSRVQVDASKKNLDYPFAFPFLQQNLPVLYQRFVAAKEGDELKSCMGDTCKACGACNDAQRRFLTGHRITMPVMRDIQEIGQIRTEKAQAKPVYVLVSLPKEYAGSHPESIAAAVMRDLCSRMPDGVEQVMTVRDALFGSDRYQGMCPWWGDDLFAVFPFSNARYGSLVAGLEQAGYQVFTSEPELSVSAAITGENLEKAAQKLLLDNHINFVRIRHETCTELQIPPKLLRKHVVDVCKIQNDVLYLQGGTKLQFSSLRQGSYIARMSLEWKGVTR